MTPGLSEAPGIGRLLSENSFTVPNHQRIASGAMPGELEPGTLTVEHILPRNPGTEWTTLTTRDPDIVDGCAFRLGNLCLLTDVNRTLGRQAFTEKAKVYGASQLLTTQEIGGNTEWGRRQIELRQSKMASMAVNIWRFQ
jgi:hypothetical protein